MVMASTAVVALVRAVVRRVCIRRRRGRRTVVDRCLLSTVTSTAVVLVVLLWTVFHIYRDLVGQRCDGDDDGLEDTGGRSRARSATDDGGRIPPTATTPTVDEEQLREPTAAGDCSGGVQCAAFEVNIAAFRKARFSLCIGLQLIIYPSSG